MGGGRSTDSRGFDGSGDYGSNGPNPGSLPAPEINPGVGFSPGLIPVPEDPNFVPQMPEVPVAPPAPEEAKAPAEQGVVDQVEPRRGRAANYLTRSGLGQGNVSRRTLLGS